MSNCSSSNGGPQTQIFEIPSGWYVSKVCLIKALSHLGSLGLASPNLKKTLNLLLFFDLSTNYLSPSIIGSAIPSYLFWKPINITSLKSSWKSSSSFGSSFISWNNSLATISTNGKIPVPAEKAI
jgi:hypothetical protein